MTIPRQVLTLLPIVYLCLGSSPALAEIYTWKDANGKTHFGDKPRSGPAADSAKKVDINEAYRPTQNLTAEEQAQLDAEQAARNRLAGLRQSDAEKSSQPLVSPEEKAFAQRCAKFFEEYQDLKGVRVKNGTPTLTYLVDEDGNSVTSLEQEALVEQMWQGGLDAGCPQFSED